MTVWICTKGLIYLLFELWETTYGLSNLMRLIYLPKLLLGTKMNILLSIKTWQFFRSLQQMPITRNAKKTHNRTYLCFKLQIQKDIIAALISRWMILGSSEHTDYYNEHLISWCIEHNYVASEGISVTKKLINIR